jgi:predicted DNA-binding mobile mystery protein A
MKPKKTNLLLQRQIIEKKLLAWLPIRSEPKPNSGWIKAIRGALGMTAKQLADRMGTTQPNIAAMEERESSGTITLETLEKTARAMDCKLIYAIVPNEDYLSLNEMLDHKAEEAAKLISKKISHPMALESQDLSAEDKLSSIQRLAKELKEKMDSRIWALPNPISKKS